MESRDLVSVSRPIFANLGLGFEGCRYRLGLEAFRSRDFEYCKKWYIKILFKNLKILFVVFAGKKQPKHVGKMAEAWKKFTSEARASAETFPGGQVRYFAYPLHVADDTMPVHVQKTLCLFYTINLYAHGMLLVRCVWRVCDWYGGFNAALYAHVCAWSGALFQSFVLSGRPWLIAHGLGWTDDWDAKVGDDIGVLQWKTVFYLSSDKICDMVLRRY